mgnify:CR=1 FL=1
MKRVKITVLKTTLDRELAEEYGAEGLTACPMLREGQVFYADYAKPEGFCDEAWKAVYQYAFALAHGAGEGLFYYGDWIRKPGVAICSCNDGLRPVIFKLEATDEDCIRAAKIANAHYFISHLPQGYDTILAEDGGNISQGQKQLLCIARAMLTKPSMLILDEATSSIDTRTEMKIQQAFVEMMKGHTSFVVAHRLSTIREADCILVMRDGQIVEQGTHEELLKQNGFYHELYYSQFAQTVTE